MKCWPCAAMVLFVACGPNDAAIETLTGTKGGASGAGFGGGSFGAATSGGGAAGSGTNGTADSSAAASGGTGGIGSVDSGAAGDADGNAGNREAGAGGSGAAGNAAGDAAIGDAGTGGGASRADAGAAGSGGMTDVPGVRIVGRTAQGNVGALRFSWPGVNIHARFTGTQLSVNLDDSNNKNRFTVVIDSGSPKTVTSTPGQTSMLLATGLPNKIHDAVIWRNTEASPGGVTQFSGLSNFGSDGKLLSSAAAPDRRVEVIGDSISAGAGVEGVSTTCSPDINAFTNNYLAYGSVAARAVQADVVTVAWSGIGVYRSYSASEPTMPKRYDYAIPNDGTAWDFSRYLPHVVVINLGTNDFGAGNPGQPYVDAYVEFVKHVRLKYAQAYFILIDMYGGERLTSINSVVSSLKAGGEPKVEALSFSAVPNNNTACNQHPNAGAQQAMGKILAARLSSLMGW